MMKEDKKSRKNPAPLKRNDKDHNGIGLPEDVRVVYGEEHNPHDG